MDSSIAARIRAPIVQYVAIAAFALFMLAQVLDSLHSTQGGIHTIYDMDFIDFYCAGATHVDRENPYLTADYDRCADKIGPTRAKLDRHLAPAPIPSYDIAFFSLLAKLPFVVAGLVWVAISFVAFLVTIPIVARLSGLPPLLVFGALAIEMRTALQWGQFSPVLMCALALGALAISERRWNLAAVALACTMIEPHLGLAACLASLIWIPKLRIPLGIALVALAAIGLVTLGLADNVLYFRKILPLQAIAEAPAENQLSLTWLLYWFGAPERLATRVGSISYAIMLVVGIVLARSSARALKTDAAIPLVPTVAAVFGGPFIHVVQVEVAVVAALLVAGRSTRYRALAWCAVIGLSVTWASELWMEHAWTAGRIESLVIAAAIGAYAFGRGTPVRLATAAAASGFAYVVLSTALAHVPRGPVRVAESAPAYAAQLGADARFTTGTWGISIRERDNARSSSYQTLLGKTPLWLSLLALLVTIAAAKPAASRVREGAVAP